MKCLLCKKRMKNMDPRGNHPSGGSEFYTSGHYGSSITDRMDGTGFAVNICDPCLEGQRGKGTVLRVLHKAQPARVRPSYVAWRKAGQ